MRRRETVTVVAGFAAAALIAGAVKRVRTNTYLMWVARLPEVER